MSSKLLTLFILAIVAAGVTSATSARAAAPQAPAALQSYTGCLTRLNLIIQVAVGDSPANPPCRDGAQIAHFAGGDLTSLTTGDTRPVHRQEGRIVPVLQLSLTEERIVLLLAAGRSNEEIAEAVGLDERTVGWHLERAGRKLERASALHKRVRGNKQ